MAAKLGEMNLASGRPEKEFRTQRVAVTRWGDILDMMQIPGLRRRICAGDRANASRCWIPRSARWCPAPQTGRALTATPGNRRLCWSSATASAGSTNTPNRSRWAKCRLRPQRPARRKSGAKRLLPGSAGFISHLALALKSPVDAIVSDGGAATDVRRKLSTNPEILEGKQVVVWEFVERDIALGAPGVGRGGAAKETAVSCSDRAWQLTEG